jgi:hypothetical protein
MKLNRQEIQKVALDYLAEHPNGARWSDILRHVQVSSPETPPNSIQGSLHVLMSASKKVEKVTRGVYQLAQFAEAATDTVVDANEPSTEPTTGDPSQPRIVEASFYDSFANWLVDDAEDVTCAVPLGGSWLKGKWGTPDVMGVLRPRSDDLLKFDTQIVSAEIKVDAAQTVIAFGQAVSYRLFSHRSYIVVPVDIAADDHARLKALCSVHGIGLVTYQRNPENPEYRVIVTPLTGIPDVYYANRMIRQLRDANEAAYRKLFD